ncbi:assimilatory sulfite reductase (NADPH) flavoprotein subunit [Paenibacillus illinoisensis]|uniref:assimilatory sulfite reductase (NADPH) flavoprotein subunit n=1 Tax=Paenibacillus illinoisensis TaxID=59845 RepID=UPI001C8E2825|nr:assimilatory sulfite reductase (NADPH) flavoprotein subunit [Paenibacillus illinoisensis]MBY0218985.1 assimilatory sulfite reductase (NADPH) flavoprotein subunit [Paenibacillus illinoisensis]
MELQVTNSPFNQEQVELLNRLIPTLNDSQKTWLSGYLTAIQGIAAVAAGTGAAPNVQAEAVAAVSVPPASREVTVLYGSQTGNSSGLSKKLAKKLEEQGLQVTLSSMGDFKPNGLKKIENLLIVVSTHGEGEPPDNAIPLHEFLNSKRAPKLDGLKYSVLALGDTSYEFFCQTGKDFDQRLQELGGTPIVPRVDCDVDFDEAAAEWMNDVLASLSSTPAKAGTLSSEAVVAALSGGESEYNRTNPFKAEVLENLNLNGRGSDRETRHIELSLEGSNLDYEPGDSLGVFPENHPRLVDELIAAMGWNADERVTVNKSGEQVSVYEALLRYFEITAVTKPVVQELAKLSPDSGLADLLANDAEFRNVMNSCDLLDLVQDYNLKGIPAGEFVAVLRKIPARLYSIASSSKSFPDEVHLTVRTVRYEARGRERYGVCSVHLAERIEAGDSLPVYIQHNPNFKLPENPDAPIIMIGPGTGVAPFRSFLGEREETGAQGKTWLFYGDQHFLTDFLYQTEWQRWLKDGVLTKMDVAFSRDTEHKVYVQHRMLENSKELYQWLQEGAVIYVCGDEKKMAHDVHGALATILEQEGGLTSEQASEYLTRLQQEKRYQRDVY